MILVALLWPQKEWFTDFLALLVEELLELPMPRYLLAQAHARKFQRGLESLCLYAWRLSSDVSTWQDFLRLQRSLLQTSGEPQHNSTRGSG